MPRPKDPAALKARVLKLRADGKSFREIGKAVGCSGSYARVLLNGGKKYSSNRIDGEFAAHQGRKKREEEYQTYLARLKEEERIRALRKA